MPPMRTRRPCSGKLSDWKGYRVAEEVRYEKLAISALRVTRQAQVGTNDAIAMEFAIDDTTDVADIRARMDLIEEIIRRQRAVNELPKAIQDLDVLRHMPAQIEQTIRNKRKEKAEIAARVQINIAAHEESKAALTRKFLREYGPRRREWQPSEGQQTQLRQFDDAIAKEKSDLETIDKEIEHQQKLLANVPSDIEAAEWEVARREAIIAGEDEPPRPGRIAEAATRGIDLAA